MLPLYQHVDFAVKHDPTVALFFKGAGSLKNRPWRSVTLPRSIRDSIWIAFLHRDSSITLVTASRGAQYNIEQHPTTSINQLSGLLDR